MPHIAHGCPASSSTSWVRQSRIVSPPPARVIDHFAPPLPVLERLFDNVALGCSSLGIFTEASHALPHELFARTLETQALRIVDIGDPPLQVGDGHAVRDLIQYRRLQAHFFLGLLAFRDVFQAYQQALSVSVWISAVAPTRTTSHRPSRRSSVMLRSIPLWLRPVANVSSKASRRAQAWQFAPHPQPRGSSRALMHPMMAPALMPEFLFGLADELGHRAIHVQKATLAVEHTHHDRRVVVDRSQFRLALTRMRLLEPGLTRRP